MITFENHFETATPTPEFEDRKEALFSKIRAEQESGKIGYYTIAENAETLLDEIDETLRSISEYKYKDIVVIGTGGSSLGAKAINSLFFERTQSKSKKLHFLENGDPAELEHLCSDISNKKSLFVVISKSGTTIETISIFKYVLERFKIDIKDPDSNKRLLFITENDSPLAALGYRNKIKVFDIPKNIGGRFSVLSSVGLVPLALAGFKVRKLLEGAKIFDMSFFNRYEDHLLQKAILYYDRREVTPIHVLFSYSSLLKHFNEWYVQLWGESLGKIDRRGRSVGFTPIGLVGSIDQHSFLQLIMQGPADKSVTFIKVNDFQSSAAIPNRSLEYLEQSDFLNGVSFADFLGAQCDATFESIRDSREIPLDRITFEKLNLKNIGSLIFYYELLTSAMGILLSINTYDQPGVELGKQKLKEMFINL